MVRPRSLSVIELYVDVSANPGLNVSNDGFAGGSNACGSQWQNGGRVVVMA
jgi:hypothetical protein